MEQMRCPFLILGSYTIKSNILIIGINPLRAWSSLDYLCRGFIKVLQTFFATPLEYSELIVKSLLLDWLVFAFICRCRSGDH